MHPCLARAVGGGEQGGHQPLLASCPSEDGHSFKGTVPVLWDGKKVGKEKNVAFKKNSFLHSPCVTQLMVLKPDVCWGLPGSCL